MSGSIGVAKNIYFFMTFLAEGRTLYWLLSLKTINVMAFYGFLEDPKIKNAVEKQCHVKFSHDTYYTNAEFLHDFHKQKDSYDVMIFSNMIYGSIKNQLPNIANSNLWKSAAEYYPYFKEYYMTHNLSYYHKTGVFKWMFYL